MNELQIFNNPDFGEIRIVEWDGEPWFVGKDIAAALGYEKPTDAVRKHIDDEDRGVSKIETPSGIQDMTIISESGVYSLIFSSKLEKAKEFKRWVTAEVLPTIRKQGGYLTPEAADRLAAAVQERIQAAWAKSFRDLAARVEALEDAVTGPSRAVPTLPAPPPPEGEEEETTPGRDFMRRWMRTASEKLDLMSSKFQTGNNAILHQIYGYIENHFNVVLEEERLAAIEYYGLDSCSTLKAVFFNAAFRGYFERTVDANLAPENRGW